MGITEETLRIINEVHGLDHLEQLRATLAGTEASVGRLKVAVAAGNVSDAEAAVVAGELARERVVLTAAIEAETVAQVNLNAAAGKAAVLFNEVAQGRIRGMSSTITGLGAALGLGGGLAGVIGIVSLAAFELIRHREGVAEWFRTLTEGADAGKTKVEALTERIKELADKPHKLAIDIVILEQARKELDVITAGMKAFEDFKARQTDDTKAAGAGVKDILGGAPGGYEQFAADLESSETRKMTAESPELRANRALLLKQKAELEALRSGPGGSTDAQEVARQERMDRLRRDMKKADDDAGLIVDKISKEAKTKVGGAIKDAEAGGAAGRGALADIVERAGGAGAAEAIRGMTPEEARARRVAEKDAERDRKRSKEQAEKDKEIDRLNLQGKENEALTKKTEEDALNKRIAEAHKAAVERENAGTAKEREDKAEMTAESRRLKEMLESAKEQKEGAMRTIADQTGGAFGKEGTEQAARRQLQLQQAGLNAVAANSQAIAEQNALMSGMVEEYRALREQDDKAIADIRRMARRMAAAASAPTEANAGAP